ncbi:MAG: hypothetical protein PHQ03_12250 [Methylococcales bacterium]|nr:hypothetical protein [Methylococcales bacterium]
MLSKRIILLGMLIMPVAAFADEVAITTTSAESQQQPNLYDLKNGSLQINYSTSGIDGKPHFSYTKNKVHLSFSGDEIRTAETDLGTVVSVTTTMTVDSGSTSFSILIPKINLDSTKKSTIKTQGIETKHTFSMIPTFNKGQVDTYKVIGLTGKVSFVMF